MIQKDDVVTRKDGRKFSNGEWHVTVETVDDRVATLSSGSWEFIEALELVTGATDDKVNKPSHYTNGEIEVIDYIRDNLSHEKFEGYCIGNVLKYVSRYGLKNGVEDLEKAQVYLGWAVESMKGANDNE